MRDSYLERRTCFSCTYYEEKEKFCAVAPHYLGKAPQCGEYEYSPEKGKKERKAGSGRIYEQFIKDYLEKLLSAYGEMRLDLENLEESRGIEVWFAPTYKEVPPELGLLGRMLDREALIEVYRSQMSESEVCEGLRKVLAENRRLPREEGLKLWVLTPTASKATLKGFGLKKSEEGETGVYLGPPILGIAIVVIHQLPRTPETLWLRLLGRGRVLREALDELEALPANAQGRSIVLELLNNWHRNLKRREQPELDAEERELMRRLASLSQPIL